MLRQWRLIGYKTYIYSLTFSEFNQFKLQQNLAVSSNKITHTLYVYTLIKHLLRDDNFYPLPMAQYERDAIISFVSYRVSSVH